MKKDTLLWPEPVDFSEKAAALLEDHFKCIKGPFSHEDFTAHIKTADYVILRLKHRLDAKILNQANNLKVIASPTTGLNHIDVDLAAKKDIQIISLKGETTFLNQIHATPEHCWALILSLLRHIPAANASVKLGEWNRDQFKAGELAGRTLGLIGYGRVGSRLAHYARAFGMSVLAYDPFITDSPDFVELTSLNNLAQRSDIISLNAAYSLENESLCDKVFFDSLEKQPLFINAARGELVDETALLEALTSHKISGAALDVLRCENDPDNSTSQKLIEYMNNHKNLIITPHIAGATYDSMHKTEEFIVAKLLAACHKSSNS